jgi:hypothetical protein
MVFKPGCWISGFAFETGFVLDGACAKTTPAIAVNITKKDTFFMIFICGAKVNAGNGIST